MYAYDALVATLYYVYNYVAEKKNQDCVGIKPGHSDSIPANKRRSSNVGTMLNQRRRRWVNVVLTLGERLVLAGMPTYHVIS